MYFSRLSKITAARGRLCIGIDPQPSVLDAWKLPHNLSGVERCARGIVDALGQDVAVFKPQSGFFEPFGSQGIAVLERLLSDIRDCGALSVLDVKRGDIGSTMAGYTQAYLSDDSPLAADAVTLSPYLGFDSLMPAIDAAHISGRGIYVLARTSNPEGHSLQLARTESGRCVAQEIVDAAAETNRNSGHNAIGVVVGGTHASLGIDLSHFNASVLVPGIGAQGGRMDDLATIFGTATGLVLPSVSREVLNVGPDPVSLKAKYSFLVSQWPQVSQT